ncbi:hypothetical protein DSQ20_03820 [Nitrosarchaeum sp. AC2]|nr:hypothetical protein DSQ20_03820 [Nitrosarchaeum sp. AC2]
MFVMVLILTVSSICSVSAQSDIENIQKDIRIEKSLSLDNILNPQIAATLTGLSLTGGTFLVNLTRSNNDDNTYHINVARKSFIKAFFMFLICTIVLFLFDFLEIIDEKNAVMYTFIDVAVSYALFGFGALFLVSAAKHLYGIYGKN